MNYQKIKIIRDFENELEVKPFNVDLTSKQEDIDNVLMLISSSCQSFIDRVNKTLDAEESFSIIDTLNQH